MIRFLMDDIMDVSIVIVSYNTRDLIRDCIFSVIEKTQGVTYEIIVVDNDSHDGSVEMLRSEFPDVVIVESGGNIGFGKANNKGMSVAKGDYLFLLNSDTVLVNNAVAVFLDRMRQLERVGYTPGALGAVLIGPGGNTCHSYGHFITPASEFKEVLSKYLRFLKDKENTCPGRVMDMKPVDYVTGADMFVPKHVFDELGGFDPDYFMYCEEVDWQRRMADAGYGRFIVEGPEIIHLEGGSDGSGNKAWSPSRLTNLYKSRKIYRKKHYDRMLLPIFRLLLMIFDAPAIVLTSILNRRKDYLQLIKLK